MKRLLQFTVSFTVLFFSFIHISEACHCLALVSPSITVGPTGVTCNASSDPSTCGCGNYWLDVEVQCNNLAWAGPCNNTNTYGPFVTSGTGCYGSTQMVKNSCVLQAYPSVFIPFTGLCPGTTYKVQMREHHATAIPPVGPWSVTFTFTTPGVPPVTTTSVTATPTTICVGQTSQLNGVLTGGCGGGTPTYSWTPTTGLSNSTIINPVASPVVTTTYTLTVTGGSCYPFPPATVTITVLPGGSPGTASVAPATICPGGSSTVTLAGYTGTIQWQSGPSGAGPWTNVPGGTNPTLGTGALATTTYYQAVVTNGCGVATSNVVAVTVSPPATLTLSMTPVLCFGGATGTASVAAAGGASPYTYSWNPTAQTTATATALTAGTYSVTVTTAIGCTATGSILVTQPTALATTFTQTNVSCNGGCNGTATVTPSGGTGAYTYSWNTVPAQTVANATGLCAGTWTCTIHDANNCVITQAVTITQPAAMAVTSTLTNVTCNAACNGTATVTPTGGTGAYTYSWNTVPAQTVANATALCAGTWTCTIHDANNCVITQAVTITQPPALTTTFTQTNVTCNAACNGTATVTPSGGTGAYTYSWNTVPSQTVANATALCAGTWTCTIHDANNCVITQVVTITQPPALATTFTQTNVTCNGGCNGTATVTPSGGTGAYTYSWNTVPAQTVANATALCAGTWTCTVHDANNCVITQVVTITQPPVLSATSTNTGSTCGNANGSVTATPAGGTGPYTFLWNPGGSTTATTTNLLAGTYTCTVTDSHGCTTTTTTTILNAGGPVATMGAPVNVSCFGGSNGSATVTVTGGATPYTYSWSPSGGTGATASGLTAGTYTVTVTDHNGCSTTATVTITQPAVLGVTIPASTNVSCNGGNNGSATSAPTGGTTPYTYSWTPTGGTGITGTSLTAGTYTVTVTDAHGCTATATIVITQPTPLTATNSQTNVSCNGGSNGTATVTPAGATPPYTYSWTGNASTTNTASGYAAGTYTCTITDAQGCSITQVVTITQPTLLTATSTNVGSTCGNPNGSVTAIGAGGTGPYGYSWNPGGSLTATTTGLMAGTYTCTVTDANGCTTTTTTTILNAGSPTVTIASSVNVACFGGSNGSATASVTGGTSPYTYSWTSNASTTATASGYAAGTYTVTVHDANGCQATVTVTITQPTLLTASISGSTNVSCFGGSNGSASAAGSGGTPPYTYSWTGNASVTSTASGYAAGTYTVTITDANGCTATAPVTITQPTQLTATNSQTNVSCNGGSDGTATVTPAGATPPYTYSWSPSGGAAATASGLAIGTYTCTITDANGCFITQTVTITQPAALVLTMSSTTAHCNQSDGTASVVVTGGTGTYTYSWSPAPVVSGQGTSSAVGFAPGNVTLTVTDANGCLATNSVLIANTPGVVASISSSTNVSCFGGNNGTATATATAGNAPYTYSWSPAPGGGQGTANATGLSNGAYLVTVTDANGCLSTANVNITQPALLTVAPMGHVTICISQCTPLTAAGSGGTPAYTYSWTDGVGPVTSPVCPVVTTTYTVVCTDANGCLSTPQMVTVTVSPPLNVTATGTASICPGASTPLGCTPSGGDGTYSYSWIPGAGLSSTTVANPTATPAATTTYTVILTDGCQTPADSATVTVTIYPTPVVTITANDTADCMPLCVNFNGTSNPACASASWNFGDGGFAAGCGAQTHCYATAGSYTVTMNVTDVNGCTGSLSKPNWITVYPLPVAAFTPSPQPTTIINSDITFTNQSTGSTAWSWSFGDLSGASSTLQNPHYVYPDTGCFNVMLIVKNTFGCKDTAYSVVCIQPDFTFFAPNAFTPNGDGVNDTWLPQGVGVDANNYKAYMYDRWGNLIWMTDNLAKGWDGRANNGADIAQVDTYVWVVDLKDFKGNKHSYRGVCNLIK